MDRRDFLTVSASSAATLTILPGTGPATSDLASEDAAFTPPIDMGEYVAKVDAGLERIGQWTPSADLGDVSGDGAATDRLAQISVQSMFLTGMLGDLPLPQQLDDRMQERVEAAMPMFNEAVDGMTGYLSTRTAVDLQRTAEYLRRPEAARLIIDRLEFDARGTGVSAPRRRQLRAMLEHVTWRLANQPPALIVNEYVDKVARAAETDLAAAIRQRHAAARVGEAAFWAQDAADPRKARRARGARTLGLGAIVFAVSAGVVAIGVLTDVAGIGVPGVIGMTVGVVMLLVGLLIFISSALMRGTPPGTTSSPTPPEPGLA